MNSLTFGLLALLGFIPTYVLESQAFSVDLVDNSYVSAKLYPVLKRKKVGTKAKLKCNVDKDRNYDIEWTFHGGRVQAKARLDKVKQTLYIPFLTVQDAGAYACKVTDALGRTKIGTTILEVISKPPKKVPLIGSDESAFSAALVPPKITKIAGTKVSLSCKVSGASDYGISWSFGGAQLNSKVRINKLGDKLFIPQLTLEDAGAYVCRVTNDLGEVRTASAILNVLMPTQQEQDNFMDIKKVVKAGSKVIEVASKKEESKGIMIGPTPAIGVITLSYLLLQGPLC